MLTATSPSRPACSRAIRINCKCALCKAPIVGTSTRGLLFACDCTAATVVRISTPPALPNRLQSANHEMHLGRHHPKSKEEDKYTSGYQREHPEQIDVEPSAAQHSDTELLVNQHRHQASYQKIAQGMHGN